MSISVGPDNPLSERAKRFDRLLSEHQEMAGEILEEAGGELLTDLRRRVGGTGKVQSWQETHVGSRKGYVAVRPAKGKTDDGYRYGYVTTKIDLGHKTRGAAARIRDYAKTHKSEQIKEMAGGLTHINGKYFYFDAALEAPRIAAKAADRIIDRMKDTLEG